MNFKVTRKAILIGCPGTGRNYLSAVGYDLQNVKNFLLSNRGGRWFDNEIITLDNPTISTALNIIQATIADYVIVYFSGHGWANNSNEKFLCLKDGDVEDLLLLSQSPRQNIFVDACRKIPLHVISGLPEEDKYLHADGYYPAREQFDKYILNSPVGQTIIHATAHDTEAFASQTGSYFTEALLNVCYSVKTENYYPWEISDVLSLVSIDLAKRGSLQIPAITYKTGNLQIPIAFGFVNPAIKNMPKTGIKAMRKRYIIKTKSSNDGLALLGIGLLIFAAESSK
ncbi:MAG: caspase family protein [Ferruginibacter sp.]